MPKSRTFEPTKPLFVGIINGGIFMPKFDYEIDDFMTYFSSKDLSKKTKRSYEQTLRLFAKYLEDVENVTINNYVRNLKVYFNFMADSYLIRVNPMSKTKFLKASRKKKHFYQMKIY